MTLREFARGVLKLFQHQPFNLLDQDLLAEVYVMFPKDGSPPKLFVTKIDDASPQRIMQLVSGTIQSACDLAKLYGQTVSGSVGPPPHCQSCKCQVPS